MQRLLFALLFAAIANRVLISVAFAAPPSGDSNPSDLGNSTVNHDQIIAPQPQLNR